jgi:hypothetical protein
MSGAFLRLGVQLFGYWLGINLTSQLAMHFTVCSSISAFFREEALLRTTSGPWASTPRT